MSRLTTVSGNDPYWRWIGAVLSGNTRAKLPQTIPAKKTRVKTRADQGFLEAIRESPKDDTTRLIYADWLEDNGQPERAEFIRLQCDEVRRFGTGGIPLNHRRLQCNYAGDPVNQLDVADRLSCQRARQWDLWRKNRHQWLGGVIPQGFRLERLWRGFPLINNSTIGMLNRLLLLCDELQPQDNWFFSLTFQVWTNDAPVSALLNHPIAKHVSSLSLHRVVGPRSGSTIPLVDAIIESPLLNRLESLRVPGERGEELIDLLDPVGETP